MGFNDYWWVPEPGTQQPFIYDTKCPYCKNMYRVTRYEQEPGFRFEEDEVCPYCGSVIRSSLEYEFFTERIAHAEKKIKPRRIR